LNARATWATKRKQVKSSEMGTSAALSKNTKKRKKTVEHRYEQQNAQFSAFPISHDIHNGAMGKRAEQKRAPRY
jgi:hypothetical protein